jgi:serine/threonine-protein kinase ATR
MLQEAKLLQAQDRVHDALLLLEPVEVDVGLLRVRMTDVIKSASGPVADTHREQAATRLLLTTDWMVEARVKHGQQVLDRYNLTTTLLPKSEACYFSLASYYDFLLDARGKELKDTNERAQDGLYQSYLRCTIENYATSLHNGLEHIFTSMPRLLTLCGVVQSMVSSGAGGTSWANRSTRTGQSQSPLLKTKQECHSHVDKAVVSVPSYAWYTCLPQLLSQLGSSIPTSNGDLRSLILDAVIKVLSSHPEQAVWSITGLTQSKESDRKRLGERVSHLPCHEVPRPHVYHPETHAHCCLIIARMCNSSYGI